MPNFFILSPRHACAIKVNTHNLESVTDILQKSQMLYMEMWALTILGIIQPSCKLVVLHNKGHCILRPPDCFQWGSPVGKLAIPWKTPSG